MYTLVPLPKGSENIEEFRIACIVDDENIALKICEYYKKRINEYNLDKNNNKELKIHTFYCVEAHYKHNNKVCYWAAMTPDVCGKGNALTWITKELKLNDNERYKIICCGDSGNDISMLNLYDINSVIVNNASNELETYYNNNKNKLKLYKSQYSMTNGVIDGLEYFGNKILNTK